MLFNTPILDVAVGFIFVFSLLALLVTQINSVIGSLLKWRSRQLKQGLQHLVTDPQLQAELLTHPLIKMVEWDPKQAQVVAQGVSDTTMMDTAKPTGITWISPQTFVEALTSILYKRASQDLFTRLTAEVDQLPVGEQKTQCRAILRKFQEMPSFDALNELRNVIQVIPDNDILLKLYDELEGKLPQISFQSSDLIGLLEGVQQVADPNLRKVLEATVGAARNLDEARQRLENWFNDGMDRVSTSFKRNMQYVTVIVSMVLVTILNVDTLQLGRALWQDRELRDSVSAVARTYAETAMIQQQAQAEESVSPEAPPAIDGQPTSDQLAAEVKDSLKQVGETYQKLIALQLPIGWDYVDYSDPASVAAFTDLGLPDPRTSGRNLWNITPANPYFIETVLQKLIGLILSAIAASQGAPFWFDLLRRITRPSSG